MEYSKEDWRHPFHLWEGFGSARTVGFSMPLNEVPTSSEEHLRTKEGKILKIGGEIICTECLSVQEHYIANILDSIEQSYEQRTTVYIANDVYSYVWDFYLGEELGLVIQADGNNGHGTRYSLTDDVIQCRVPYIKNILHLTVETEEELREAIVKALDNITDF